MSHEKEAYLDGRVVGGRGVDALLGLVGSLHEQLAAVVRSPVARERGSLSGCLEYTHRVTSSPLPDSDSVILLVSRLSLFPSLPLAEPPTPYKYTMSFAPPALSEEAPVPSTSASAATGEADGSGPTTAASTSTASAPAPQPAASSSSQPSTLAHAAIKKRA